MNKPKLTEQLEISYKLDHLKIFFNKFVINFIEQNIALCKKYDVPLKLINTEKKQGNKGDYISALTVLMLHKELFLAMVEAMPPDVRSLVKELVWRQNINAQEIKQKYQIDVFQGNPSYLSNTNAYSYVTPLLLMMNVSFDNDIYFYFEPSLKEHLSSFFERPNDTFIQVVAEQSINKKYIRFEQVESIFVELPILRTYYAQGQIKVNDNTLKPNVSSLNKARKICNIREFYEKDADKALHNIRTATMVELFLHENLQRNRFESKPTEQYIKSFYQGFVDGQYASERLLPHIKGWSYLYQNDIRYGVNQNLDTILQELPLMEWVDVENILLYTRFSSLDLELVIPYKAGNTLYAKIKSSQPRHNYYYYDRGYIKKNLYEPIIIHPLIKGFLMMCASIGLLDIVYEESETYLGGLADDGLIFPYEGIKFVRLTSFGAYVLGRFPSYEAPKVKETSVKLDEDGLFIHYPSENKALLGMIESISRPAGNNLFKVDFETVLGKCNNKKEIDMQINTFKKLLSDNPPQIWKDFFSALQEKSYTFRNKNEEYVIYTLPENKELISLFAKDEYLKKYVVRAEYYHILIPRKSLSIVKKHLKKSGFLIEFE